MTLKIDRLIGPLFLWTLFLYPFVFFGHYLYIVPQTMIVVILFLNERKVYYDKNMSNRLIFFVFVFSSNALALFVEFFSSSPNYVMAFKLFVNAINLSVLLLYGGINANKVILFYIRLMLVIWLGMVVAIYLFNHINLADVITLFSSGDELNSSSLYGLAEPLAQVFLTKNISAMFVVSLFCFYGYISIKINEKISLGVIFLFFVLVLSFFSRQGILTYFVALCLYVVINSSLMMTLFVIAVGFISGTLFFLTFFNLNNNGDGASQRLELWMYFLDHYDDFFALGYGLNKLNSILNENVGIDNFHMFFMNQIGLYGVFHFVFFTVACASLYLWKPIDKPRLLLIAGYYLNVVFQTYGYEYGNLFLIMAMFIFTNKEFNFYEKNSNINGNI